MLEKRRDMELARGDAGATMSGAEGGVRRLDGGRLTAHAPAGLAVCAASALSVGAAMIHLWAAPGSLEEWWGYGAFFLAAALAQGVFGVLILRYPARLLSLAGIAGNLSIVALYLLTRTYGVPLGSHAGEIETAGVLDTAATAAELGVILALVALLDGAYRRTVVNALLLAGLAAWALRLTGILP